MSSIKYIQTCIYLTEYVYINNTYTWLNNKEENSGRNVYLYIPLIKFMYIRGRITETKRLLGTDCVTDRDVTPLLSESNFLFVFLSLPWISRLSLVSWQDLGNVSNPIN